MGLNATTTPRARTRAAAIAGSIETRAAGDVGDVVKHAVACADDTHQRTIRKRQRASASFKRRARQPRRRIQTPEGVERTV
jgi:hypothetical protein